MLPASYLIKAGNTKTNAYLIEKLTPKVIKWIIETQIKWLNYFLNYESSLGSF